MPTDIVHGARAIVKIQGQPVGLFTQCSWGQAYGLVPINILGAHAPVDLVWTHQDAIAVDMTGFHMIEKDVYVKAGMPKLQELLTKGDINVTVEDRQTGKEIVNVTNVKPYRWGTATNARDISTFTVSMLGLKITTSGNLADGEAPNAASLPTDNGRIV